MTDMPDASHLALADCPTRALATGEALLEEGVPTASLFVLERGAVEVVRGGVRVVRIDEPGAFLGEIAALLDMPPTASVVALEPTVVRVIANAVHRVQTDPALTVAIARLLARRLHAVTAYLVDLRRQYADTDSHLALMDQVLAQIITMQGRPSAAAGSEREDVPPY